MLGWPPDPGSRVSCSHQELSETQSAPGRATCSNKTPSGTRRSMMSRPLSQANGLMGEGILPLAFWPQSLTSVSLSTPIKLMESHTLGKGCKIHGVDSLLLCPFLNKANMARYYVYVASRRGWCLGQSQEGSPRLLKMEAHCSLIFVKMPGRDTKIFRGYLYVFFPGLSYQKVCLPNPMISEKQQLLDFFVLTWVLVHFGVSRAAWDTWDHL